MSAAPRLCLSVFTATLPRRPPNGQPGLALAIAGLQSGQRPLNGLLWSRLARPRMGECRRFRSRDAFLFAIRVVACKRHGRSAAKLDYANESIWRKKLSKM